MSDIQAPLSSAPLRSAIQDAYLRDENSIVEDLLALARCPQTQQTRIQARASALIQRLREPARGMHGLDAFMHEYDLSSEEGVTLMCLAEALLRIPDRTTADRLIQDKLAPAHWQRHLGHSPSLFVNAATWGLLLTGRIVHIEKTAQTPIASTLKRLLTRSSEPAIRLAIKEAMRIMARQFVMGETIQTALARSQETAHSAYRYSFDMLGEAALGASDAQRYFQTYSQAIEALAKVKKPSQDTFAAAGISIKLSALHPRFEFAQTARLQHELVPQVRALCLQAKHAGIALTLDSEEADRLEPLLDVFTQVFFDPALEHWEGFGLALQAYQKRALPVLALLHDYARSAKRRIALRLVKGAYWDSEIKQAQQNGLSGYPVFTRKSATDVSYLACAKYLLAARDAFYPQFATHNAHSSAAIVELAGDTTGFEFQRLHGMGERLHERLMQDTHIPCRVYAPVGGHKDLLPYLVRRLLENGANTSFVNRIADAQAPIDELITDPVHSLTALADKTHPRIALPHALYPDGRRNARGVNLSDTKELHALQQTLHITDEPPWQAHSLIDGKPVGDKTYHLHNPADLNEPTIEVHTLNETQLLQALASAERQARPWSATPVSVRAACLEQASDLIEQQQGELAALIMREGGRCLSDALSEIREAVDYCRYYAAQAVALLNQAQVLPGPTGEDNRLSLHARGVFACISPWNFPLAIFIGQVSAALVAGNCVIAKPASQTPLIAQHAVKLLHQAGVPQAALQLVIGSGAQIGRVILSDPRINAVVFTGSTDTARSINQQLAQRPGPMIPFIAETGGQNTLIADSSALPETLVQDALRSAFNSAGQRCSALRVLFVQEDIAARVMELLHEAMQQLNVGDPTLLSTDVGPLIDAPAKHTLQTHIHHMKQHARLISQTPLGQYTARGHFIAPSAFEINHLSELTHEVFGPVLHVIRYPARDLDKVIEQINQSGYGLTLGIHSRIETHIAHIIAQTRVGNTYVNRNMIGAVVGVQPFGGEGLSGTGPKAGGPHYLHAFLSERSVSTNTAAMGGNTHLLSLDENDVKNTNGTDTPK